MTVVNRRKIIKLCSAGTAIFSLASLSACVQPSNNNLSKGFLVEYEVGGVGGIDPVSGHYFKLETDPGLKIDRRTDQEYTSKIEIVKDKQGKIVKENKQKSVVKTGVLLAILVQSTSKGMETKYQVDITAPADGHNAVTDFKTGEGSIGLINVNQFQSSGILQGKLGEWTQAPLASGYIRVRVSKQ